MRELLATLPNWVVLRQDPVLRTVWVGLLPRVEECGLTFGFIEGAGRAFRGLLALGSRRRAAIDG
ncbi:MAG: hypothetical protein OXT72_05580 [Gammaproteobacteria bacterium]|nr:hypothetical protein [Gammaproteobacteria bacterium]